jgi:hypothetical protein
MKTLKEIREELCEMKTSGWIHPDGTYHSLKDKEMHADHIRKMDKSVAHNDDNHEVVQHGIRKGYSRVVIMGRDEKGRHDGMIDYHPDYTKGGALKRLHRINRSSRQDFAFINNKTEYGMK